MTFSELYEVCFTPVNATLTVLLILCVVYWLVTIVGGLDFDLDLDFDVDVDADVELDSDIPDATIDVPSEPSAFMQFLKFLNLDAIPIAFFGTLVVLFTWLLSVNLTYYLGAGSLMQILMVIPAFIASLFITKLVTQPLRKVFKMINHKGEEPIDFLGRTGRLIAGIDGDKLGMMELYVENDPIKIMVKSHDGKPLQSNQKVEVTNEEENKKYYYVKEVFEL